MAREPENDSDGYPTELTLEALKGWPYPDPTGALDFMAAAWHWPHLVTRELKAAEREVCHADPGEAFIRFATGGWSGNEDLIAAFEQNLNYMLSWELSGSGGLHIFKYKQPAKKGSR